jgi:cell division protein FtsB
LRTLALGLVLLVAFIVLAPTARAYVTQREQFRQVNAQLANVGTDVEGLDRELGRWRDTGFVQAQARERLGFVRPGEIPYRVIDPQAVLGEDASDADLEGLTIAVDTAPVVPWYLTMWESVVDAGEPVDKVDAIDILTGAPVVADQPAPEPSAQTPDGAAHQ